jgi:glycerol-3-phosphate dehydrogenase
MAPSADASVAVIGGGVIGAAVVHALASRGVASILLEAEAELALGASGSNSGILHTGFDATPGELETRLILRSAVLRERWLAEAAFPLIRCGATLQPRGEPDARTVAALAEQARVNGVEVELGANGTLEVPGEAVTDPVAYTLALAATAARAGSEVRTGARVAAIRRAGAWLVLDLEGGGTVACRAAVNCAGLFADEVARMVGDNSFGVYPRKGEFFVFDPAPEPPLERILLPVPTKRTKGVLVFPTIDGRIVAGPTAYDQEDKEDWSVRGEATEEVLAKARRMLPQLEGAEPISAYAGLRPAGRGGANYVIRSSAACPQMVHVAAIRSTGLSASLAIGEHVMGILSQLGIEIGPYRTLPAYVPPASQLPWWARTALYRANSAT